MATAASNPSPPSRHTTDSHAQAKTVASRAGVGIEAPRTVNRCKERQGVCAVALLSRLSEEASKTWRPATSPYESWCVT